ncbi:unnamed protein product [Oikopleura dioica]|uniref:Doublecortin domain-containing protein n=1 Tax=Oikopleura dioica TaxID=34765 RepID=E4X818_OIKDI|nr:unnamed protein product [Oikopleura dioica]
MERLKKKRTPRSKTPVYGLHGIIRDDKKKVLKTPKVVKHVEGSKCLSNTNFTAARKINIFVNGDCHSPAKQFIIPKNAKKASEPEGINGFLSYLTNSLREKFQFRESIYHLLTPYGGTRVNTLSELKDGGEYVACHRNRLIKIDYDSIGRKDSIKARQRGIHTTWSKLRKDSQMFSEPARHWQKFSKYYNKQASELKSHYIEDKKIKTITIFCNGNTVESTKILLTGKLAEPGEESFRLVLNYISEKVGTKLASTRSAMAARRLYTLKGRRLKNAGNIKNNGCYIVCGDQKLKAGQYGKDIDLQAPWQRAIKPVRTTSGAIKQISEKDYERPLKKRMSVHLPKIQQKRTQYSDKYLSHHPSKSDY